MKVPDLIYENCKTHLEMFKDTLRENTENNEIVGSIFDLIQKNLYETLEEEKEEHMIYHKAFLNNIANPQFTAEDFDNENVKKFCFEKYSPLIEEYKEKFPNLVTAFSVQRFDKKKINSMSKKEKESLIMSLFPNGSEDLVLDGDKVDTDDPKEKKKKVYDSIIFGNEFSTLGTKKKKANAFKQSMFSSAIEKKEVNIIQANESMIRMIQSSMGNKADGGNVEIF